MAGGERTGAGEKRPLDALRENAAARTDELPDRLTDPADADPYDVEQSDAMQQRLEATRRRLQEEMAVGPAS
jgi:hypothetical protein